MDTEETVHFFTALVLCARPERAPELPTPTSIGVTEPAGATRVSAPDALESGGASSSGRNSASGATRSSAAEDASSGLSRSDGGTTIEAERSTALLLNERRHPPNPVLIALELASACADEAGHHTRDRTVADQLMYASAILERIASGFVHVVERATVEREDFTRSFNTWTTGKQSIEPRIARDYFMRSTLHHAAGA